MSNVVKFHGAMRPPAPRADRVTATDADGHALGDDFADARYLEEWLDDTELAAELAEIEHGRRAPLHGAGKWLAGGMLIAVAATALLIAWMVGARLGA